MGEEWHVHTYVHQPFLYPVVHQAMGVLSITGGAYRRLLADITAASQE